jgi:CRISPR-associated Cas5-like protein
MPNLFTMRLAAPIASLSGPRIDTVGDSLPIPTRSMITGIIGAALGISYDQPQMLQQLQDAMRLAVCQIASKSDPFSRARATPSEGAKTGVAEPHIAEQSRSWRGRVASGGLSAVLEAPAVVAGLDDVAVVCQAIEHGGRHFGVTEHLRPIGEGQIGGDQQ